MKKTIYLSGKISDNTLAGVKRNLKKFFVVEKRLKKKGYDVFNPADHEDASTHSILGREDGTWEHYLSFDVIWIVTRRPMMYMMKGWEKSRGARLEHAVARRLNLFILYEEEGQ